MSKNDRYVRVMLDGLTINPHVYTKDDIIKNPPEHILAMCGKPTSKHGVVVISATQEEADLAEENGKLMGEKPDQLKATPGDIELDKPKLTPEQRAQAEAEAARTAAKALSGEDDIDDPEDGSEGWNDEAETEDDEEDRPVVKKTARKKTARKSAKKKTARK